VDRAQTVRLAQTARRLLVKRGQGILRVEAGARPSEDVLAYLVHEDGFLRVPVLVIGDLLVRGYTEDLYREALGVTT